MCSIDGICSLSAISSTVKLNWLPWSINAKVVVLLHHGRMKPALVVVIQTIEVVLNKNSKTHRQ